jgi:hypothetical protein
VIPPVAEIGYAYTVPGSAPGSEGVVIDSTMVGLTVTLALDFFVVSAVLVAVTVTFVLLVTLGAVNIPLLVIAPPVAFQVTAVFEVLLTVAVNSWFPAEMRRDEVGETATLTAVGGFTVTMD